MNTFRRLTCKWNKPFGSTATLILAMLVVARAAGVAGTPPDSPRTLPPFLDAFRDTREASVITKGVFIDSVAGRVNGSLARPDTKERLPAVLLIPDATKGTVWTKEIARELSSVGYIVLTVDPQQGPPPTWTDEHFLTRLSAVVRWLRRRVDLLPERIGVVGLSGGGRLALLLAASMPLQACVVCDGKVLADAALLAGLRGTPLLGVFAGKAKSAEKELSAFRQALAAARIPHQISVREGIGAGFLGPPEQPAFVKEAADRTWVEIYEFLGKYVEDAPQNSPFARPPRSRPATKEIATIADLMRAVNEPTGVRGTLLLALQREPKTQPQWDRVRATAALLSEAGNLLQDRTPPRGTQAHWLEQAKTYTATAETIVTAADRRDYAAARFGLEELGARCAACHERHR